MTVEMERRVVEVLSQMNMADLRELVADVQAIIDSVANVNETGHIIKLPHLRRNASPK